jgi:hypothetical protein
MAPDRRGDHAYGGQMKAPVVYQSQLPSVAHAAACAVVREARDSGLGRHLPDERIEPAVEAASWAPEYVPLPV